GQPVHARRRRRPAPGAARDLGPQPGVRPGAATHRRHGPVQLAAAGPGARDRDPARRPPPPQRLRAVRAPARGGGRRPDRGRFRGAGRQPRAGRDDRGRGVRVPHHPAHPRPRHAGRRGVLRRHRGARRGGPARTGHHRGLLQHGGLAARRLRRAATGLTPGAGRPRYTAGPVSWSIWILEYGYVDRFPASNLFAAQPNEGYRRMPYCFGLLRSAERCVLVDTGFADPEIYRRLTAKYGETKWCAPVDVLGRVGVHPEEVDTILLTHNHFDHAGCVDAFPAAHVWIQRREIESYLAAAARPARFEFLTRACQRDLPQRLAARPATLADGAAVVAPGVELRPAYDTHTAGSQVVAVTN